MFGPPDLDPLTAEGEAVEPLFRDGAIPEDIGRELTLRSLAQEAMRDELNTGIDEGRDAAGQLALQLPARIHVEIARPVEIGGARVRHQQQKGVHPFGIPVPRQVAKGVQRAIQPDTVRIAGEERVGQHPFVPRLHHPATRFEKLIAFVREDDCRAGPVANMRF